MITSKLTTKAQTVIPQAVRQHLGIGPGDEVEYELVDGAAVIKPKKVPSVLPDDPFALFGEWSGEADEEAYGDL